MNKELISSVMICPICGEAMVHEGDGNTLKCCGVRAHSYDIAALGYINLAGPKQSGGGDSKELVHARSQFLLKGHYKPFADAVESAVSRYSSGGLVVDAGCGEGYYTNRIAKSLGCDIIGFDLSKFAVAAAAKAAGKADSKTLFCVAGIFNMPLKSGCADIVVNLFAPCAEEEFTRVLKPGGYLITAGAGPMHLFGLKSAIYDTPTKNEPRADMPHGLTEVEKLSIKFNVNLTEHDDIVSLFSMTPYYYRTGKADTERLLRLMTLETEADIDLFIYKK